MTNERLLWVFAGPNGSGKSTVVQSYIKPGICPSYYICPDQYVDADKREDKAAYIRAMEKAELMRMNQVSLGLPFSFETVLSTRGKLDFIRDAKSKGYSVTTVYVVTSDYNINLRRIAERVSRGGHNVPPDKVISRYERSMSLMFDVIMESHSAMVYDNSGSRPELRLFKEYDGTVSYIVDEGNPLWIRKYLLDKADSQGLAVKRIYRS